MTVGIVGYGGYVPRYRITPENIGKVWGVDGIARGKGLGIQMKSIPSPDEDVITIAVSAARRAMKPSPVALGPEELSPASQSKSTCRCVRLAMSKW